MKNITNITTDQIYKIKPDDNGWRELPDGRRIKLGMYSTLGRHVTLGQHVVIGRQVDIGDNVVLESDVTIGDDCRIGSNVALNNSVTLGQGVTLGHHVALDSYVVIGEESVLGHYVKLRKNVRLGVKVALGNRVKLSEGVHLGNYVNLGPGVTSKKLNLDFIAALPEKFIAWKWVNKNRRSPLRGDKEYTRGSIVTEPDAVISDQQCATGLHVMRVGYRPEYVGLTVPGHNWICLLVEVRRRDVCFGGLPTMDGKLRVKRLKVLT